MPTSRVHAAVTNVRLTPPEGGADNDAFKLGAACKPSAVPLNTAAYSLHDGVDQAGPKVRAAGPLLPGFPYLGTPLAGAQ